MSLLHEWSFGRYYEQKFNVLKNALNMEHNTILEIWSKKIAHLDLHMKIPQKYPRYLQEINFASKLIFCLQLGDLYSNSKKFTNLFPFRYIRYKIIRKICEERR